LRDECSQKVSKNLKIVCAQVTQTKTGLSTVRTFNPLGVKVDKNPTWRGSWMLLDALFFVEEGLLAHHEECYEPQFSWESGNDIFWKEIIFMV
jgi:hypothetical protein